MGPVTSSPLCWRRAGPFGSCHWSASRVCRAWRSSSEAGRQRRRDGRGGEKASIVVRGRQGRKCRRSRRPIRLGMGGSFRRAGEGASEGQVGRRAFAGTVGLRRARRAALGIHLVGGHDRLDHFFHGHFHHPGLRLEEPGCGAGSAAEISGHRAGGGGPHADEPIGGGNRERGFWRCVSGVHLEPGRLSQIDQRFFPGGRHDSFGQGPSVGGLVHQYPVVAAGVAGVLLRQAIMNCKRTTRTRAFTLVEIMVALTIFAAVLVAIYSSWSALLRGKTIGMAAAAEAQRARVAVRALENSLVSLQMFQANLKYYSFFADTSGDFASLSFVARLPQSFPRSGDFGDQVLRRLTFTVEPGTNRENVLVLRQNPVLFDPGVDEEENPLVLARRVKAFTLEFWGPRSTDWEPE